MIDTPKLDVIKAALDAATPGPWRHDLNGYIAPVDQSGEWSVTVAKIPCYIADRDKANAHLIANAPSWLSWLVGEVERLTEERATERREHTTACLDRYNRGYDAGVRLGLEERDVVRRTADELSAAVDRLSSDNERLKGELETAKSEAQRLRGAIQVGLDLQEFVPTEAEAHAQGAREEREKIAALIRAKKHRFELLDPKEMRDVINALESAALEVEAALAPGGKAQGDDEVGLREYHSVLNRVWALFAIDHGDLASMRDAAELLLRGFKAHGFPTTASLVHGCVPKVEK